ncbi:sulfatase [Marinoscillum sp. MHG1-6]|uniref:sulfatase n=1 Tax=Marinoscillum sp. MHG1-6 TaxID=2959627 RepID=UPI002157A7EB|nr:sulfatase [Marinoscillum sp. MHG1-6]
MRASYKGVVVWLVIILLGFHLKAQEKNVLFIIVDDLKPMINGFDQEQMITPNLDALMAKSTSFTNAHCQQAVCAPSRVSFLTGMRPDYTKVWDLKTKMRDMVPDILTMPEYFKQQGYETVGMGKVLHGAVKNDVQSWTRPFVEDLDLTYVDGYGIPANFDYQSPEALALYNEIKEDYPGDPTSDKVWRAVNREFKKRGVRQSTECIDVPDDAYADGAIALESMRQMEELSKGDLPFFMVVGFHKPHLPFVAPKKYWDLYDRNEIQLAEFQEHAQGSPAYAYHTFGELKNYSDIKGSLNEKGAVIEAKQRELIHGYYACVSYVDAQIGKVLGFLKESGLERNTTVVLVGDHGWHLGDHGLWNKHSNFEQATRTPLMISDPDYANAQRNDSPVELIDIFPTICDLTGVETPGHLPGTSLLPIVSGKTKKVKEAALSQYPRGDRMGYALRNERYRYIEWHQGTNAQNGNYKEENLIATELYDYEEDPLEKVSRANDPEYDQVMAEMKSYLKSCIEK